MSSALQRVVRLIPVDKAIDASGGDATFDSATLDLRRIARINSVIARGISVASQPDYRIYWYGGITTSEVEGNATGMTGGDAFETATNHDALIDTYPSGKDGEGSEQWIASAVPDIPWPFVRFRVLVKGGSPSDAKFNLFALVQDRFDV